MGLGDNCNKVYLIDYGLAKKYVNSVTREHIPFSNKKRMVGTVRYCSLNSLMGCEQSRRDDLESLGYCLIYMLKGSLPWQGIRRVTKEEKNLKVRDMKEKISLAELCKGLPKEVLRYMHYCRTLSFDENPPYYELHSLLNKVLIKNTCLKNSQYDWHAVKHITGKGEKNNSENSNRAECEGMVKDPQKNMLRRVEIKNLVSKVNFETAGKNSIVIEDESIKMPDKSKTLHVESNKKSIPPLLKSANMIKRLNESEAIVTQNKVNNQKTPPNHKTSNLNKFLYNFKTANIEERNIMECVHENGNLE